MKGISVTRMNGKIIFVNVDDECGNKPIPYPVNEYVDRGYEPDYTTLPDENTAIS